VYWCSAPTPKSRPSIYRSGLRASFSFFFIAATHGANMATMAVNDNSIVYIAQYNHYLNTHYRDIYGPAFPYDAFDYDHNLRTQAIFNTVFQKVPHEMQFLICNHLGRMHHHDHPLPKSSVVAVLPTSYGKSAIRDCHAVAVAGVTLTIVPLLSIGTDQASKLHAFSKPETGLIHSFNLDDYRTEGTRRAFCDRIEQLPLFTKQSVLLFCSPQTIVGSEVLQGFIKRIIRTKLLRLLCIDEVHLFVDFGLAFRDEFGALRPFLFDLLWNDPPSRNNRQNTANSTTTTTIPILFMTATASKPMCDDMERLCGISLTHDLYSVFWGDAMQQMCRKQSMSVLYSTTPINEFKKFVLPQLRTNVVDKYMWLTNNRFLIEKHDVSIVQLLDEDPLVFADVVPLNGSLIKEQKMWNVIQFCKSNVPNIPKLKPEIPETERPFNPQLLNGTNRTTCAGLDSNDIVGVVNAELLGSTSEVSQLKGRAGRATKPSPDRFWFLMIVSLDSYCNLLRRNFLTFRETKNQHLYNLLQSNLAAVLEGFVLPQMCLHSFLEIQAANPFYPQANRAIPPPCEQWCSFCRREYPRLFPVVHRLGVQQVIMDIFVNPTKQVGGVLTLDDTLVQSIRCYKSDDDIDSMKLILGSDAKGDMRPIDVKKLLLMLCSSGIISVKPQVDREKQGYSSIVLLPMLSQHPITKQYLLYSENHWSRIPQKQ
jgi:hypothetical protein